MKLIRGLIMAGIAKKLYDEARKPHNQEKIRGFVDKLRGQSSDDADGRGTTSGWSGSAETSRADDDDPYAADEPSTRHWDAVADDTTTGTTTGGSGGARY